ncbi:VIT-domain-containing protein [Hymenopellis radicata]|nr:VIT-domain-containing protein [Hymenopellis radicata]
MAQMFWGICYQHNHHTVSLPLLQVSAIATVKELGAQVKLTQKFVNDARIPIEAVYSFPVPARAAVCQFIMVKQDGTRVQGLVQEKSEARETYDAALAKGKTASLATQQTPDVFQVSVGNLAPQEEIQIELTYATELTEDEENDSIRLHLPAHIGCRYGQVPSPIITTKSPFINVDVSVESVSPIRKIGSPSHSISTELGPDPSLPSAQYLPFSNYARVSLASNSPLEKDFVLTIQSAGLDTPRCIAECHPEHESIGVLLTLVPRFHLPEPDSQEFIFLVDRSGSMQGNRITAARRALIIMLRSLPHKNTAFQIASFGNRTSMLWEDGSRLYDQQTLDEATRHVDDMQADYGGTQIGYALSTCFEKRKFDRPTSVVVLTDGDAWDNESVFQTVMDTVGSASSGAYLRVFCLGIGNSASTAMCEGIGRAGNGTSIMVGEDEASITGKVARLLMAARTPRISKVRIDWDRPKEAEDDFEMVDEMETAIVEEGQRHKLNIFDESVDTVHMDSTEAPPSVPILPHRLRISNKAPSRLNRWYPDFDSMYMLFCKNTLPKTVTIRGTTQDGSEIELPVSVTFSGLPNDTSGAPPPIHALAARKIVQELEDGRYDDLLKASYPDSDLPKVVDAHIVRLGKTYSIASSQTSFVAVDDKSSVPPSAQPSLFTEMTRTMRKGRMSVIQSAAGSSYRDIPKLEPITARLSLRTVSVELGCTSQKPDLAMCTSVVSPRVRSKRGAARRESRQASTGEFQAPMDVLESLARMQLFDGSFAMKVLSVLKEGGLAEDQARAAFPGGTQDVVVATVLAVVFISAQAAICGTDDKVVWEGLFKKAWSI